MVFLIFGPEPTAIAVGNDVFTTQHGMPNDIVASIEDGTISGENIEWGSLGPGGICCFSLNNGQIYRTEDANLLADLNVDYGDDIEHLTFSPGGGWFVRYSSGNVRLSVKGSFSESFHQLAKGHMITKGKKTSSPQQSDIECVFFGAGNTILIKLEDGSLMWEALPKGLVEEIRTNHELGYSVSKKTQLSPHDNQHYFLYWEKAYEEDIISYQVPPIGIIQPLLLRETFEGKYPVSHHIHTAEDNSSDESIKNIQQKSKSSFEEICGSRTTITAKEFQKFLSRFELSEVDAQDLWKVAKLEGHATMTLDDFTVAMWVIADTAATGSESFEIPSLEIREILKIQQSPQQTCDRGAQKDPLINKVHADKDDWVDTSSIEDRIGLASGAGASGGVNEEDNEDHIESERPNADREADSLSRAADDAQLRLSLLSSIVKEKPNVQWEDVAGLNAAKEELQEAVVLPRKFPKMFCGDRKPRRGILLYGPPGTGKSYLAKAVATEIESTLFSISSSDVVSKWYGESERLVKSLFELARQNRPSIIFIDEIDALCGNRDGAKSNEDTARMKTELMVQIDGVGHDNTGVLLLAATNLPWSLDPAMRRRFQRKIHIPLPDESARTEMFKIYTRSMACGLTDGHYTELAKQTDGFSGSDISIAVQDALMQPVKKISSSKHWRKVQHEGIEKLTPCKPEELGAMPMNWRKVPASKLLEPEITAEDFFQVLSKVKASVGQNELGKYHEWTERYGLEGA